MTPTERITAFLVATASGMALTAIPDLSWAQQAVQGYPGYGPYGSGPSYGVQYTIPGSNPPPVSGYTYRETAPQAQNPLIFGVAAFKICQIKNFLFAGVYILGAIAFVVFAIRALFTKFEMKHFIPIIGALFVVATADLFIYWMSEDAYFCPTSLSTFG